MLRRTTSARLALERLAPFFPESAPTRVVQGDRLGTHWTVPGWHGKHRAFQALARFLEMVKDLPGFPDARRAVRWAPPSLPRNLKQWEHDALNRLSMFIELGGGM